MTAPQQDQRADELSGAEIYAINRELNLIATIPNSEQLDFLRMAYMRYIAWMQKIIAAEDDIAKRRCREQMLAERTNLLDVIDRSITNERAANPGIAPANHKNSE